MLLRGFAYWRRRPGLMLLGLVPAVIVGLLLFGGLITLAAFLPGLTEALTPFADGWPSVWAAVIRITIGTALVGAALVLVAISFTALTLLIGEPFYERIWRAVEADHGDERFDASYGFWRSVGDALSLVGRGILIAVLALALGFIPVVGGVVSAVVGVILTGWVVADELSSRALSARGLTAAERKRLRRGHRARVLGFGVATQLCFLVPLGAVASMPAAVAGSTLLARSLLDEQNGPGRASA
ncbi:EI24 domain-containing protein [Microbacterium jejuense]|uniref:EI24 domain-containing protein n=2 Tax=Microbacterium jejuense TaxID=1263637 RepID=A0ABS7HJN7_9MICO|nr:EI24 domain-containing protein [Microbacterium jejuense]